MKTQPSTPWSRLVTVACRAPLAGDAITAGLAESSAPFGFSARVVANACIGSAPSYGAVFERLAARAFGLACAFALAMVVWGSLPSSAEAKSSDLGVDFYDPVGDVITATQS
jgi:hypothetical protein